MSSVCFFATYFKEPRVPYYTQFYLTELKRHFTKVVLLSHHNELNEDKFLKESQIELFVTPNEGWDFGQWYDALQKFDISAYDSVGLVNDSCILFKSLDKFFNWSKNTTAAYKGITENHNFYRHIQSYFIVFEKPVFSLVLDYFKKYKKQQSVTDVVHVYEVGLSKHLIENNFEIAAYISNDGYDKEYSPYFYLVKEQIKQGIPVIKKKIIYSSYRKDELLNLARMDFNIDPHFYIQLCKENGAIINFDKVLADEENAFNAFDKLRYSATVLMVKAIRLFKKPK